LHLSSNVEHSVFITLRIAGQRRDDVVYQRALIGHRRTHCTYFLDLDFGVGLPAPGYFLLDPYRAWMERI